MTCSSSTLIFCCLAVSCASAQWWPPQWFTRTTTTTTTKPFITTKFPFFPSMQTGAQKTTPSGPKPPNDNFAIPCGYSNYTEKEGIASLTSQGIVGGTEARRNEFPYQARINYNGGFICGGSIISNRHILTAAHCIVGPASSYQVVLGDHNQKMMESGEKTYRISKIIVHPKNSQQTNQYDLAILVTSDVIALDRTSIRTVCLPDANVAQDAFVGQNAIVTGWGKLTESGSTSTVLQKAFIPVISQQECLRSYGSSSITSDMICSGYKNGGIDSCQGDSGGPFVILGQNGRFYLQGVVSWGYGCARAGYPGVYARTAFTLDWITSTMASN